MRGKNCELIGTALRASTVLVLLGAASCSTLDVEPGESGDGLVSNRPQTDRFFSAIVKLATPALLDTATPDANGVMVIDRAAAARIADEQRTFIQGLERRSPEVRVLYTYRMVLNGVSILAPVSMREEIGALEGIAAIEEATAIAPPRAVAEAEAAADAPAPQPFTENSVKWIGATKARTTLGLTGRGVRIGVIDTGIDYTHKMFGGPGTRDAYRQNQPTVVEPGSFPTRKVVGGKDFVGSEFDPASYLEAKRIPKPDDDPLDEQGHGTHVAGTIAGVGDGVNTYDGVAPDAELHALKVFGKGATSEAAVVAAMEYAADPNGDGDLSDRLDIVNLSLGSLWGTRFGLYAEVVTSLTRGGTLFVAAAGNSGPERYIVASPSTADDALSVAASTDNAGVLPADRLVSFSSWGPRSLDAMLKPEVSAPGSRIVSASMSSGDRGIVKSGTSMASPHIAGVAALLRQAHPKSTPAELKSLIMNTGVAMKDRSGDAYAVSKVGAGRVQAYEAALSPLVFDPPALSFGIVAANTVSRGTRMVTVSNISDADVRATVTWSTSAGLSLRGPSNLDIPAHGTVRLPVEYAVDVTRSSGAEVEMEGRLIVSVPTRPSSPPLTLQIPALAVATRGSEISLNTQAPLARGPVSIALSNRGPVDGDVLAFNLLARDEVGSARNGACDLSSAGYRIVRRTVDGTTKQFLQFGFNLASPLSTWNFCELTVLVDENGDGIAEQEIAGTFDTDLRASASTGSGRFGTFLVDAPAMRELRARIERGESDPSKYPTTVLDEQPFVLFANSTVAYISADLSKLKKTASGKLRVKVGVLPASAGAVVDDFLDGDPSGWFSIDPLAVPYTDMSERVSASARSSSTLEFKSAGLDRGLVVYLPQNTSTAGRSVLVNPNGQLLPIP